MPRKRDPGVETNPIAARLAAEISTDLPPKEEEAPPAAANDSPGPAEPAPAKVEQKPKPTKPRAPRVRTLPAVKRGTSLVPKKVLFTPAEIEQNEEIAALLTNMVGGKLTVSAVTRAMWSLLRGSEDAIAATRKHAPDLSRRPATADKVATAEYEDQIAEYLLLLMKNS